MNPPQVFVQAWRGNIEQMRYDESMTFQFTQAARINITRIDLLQGATKTTNLFGVISPTTAGSDTENDQKTEQPDRFEHAENSLTIPMGRAQQYKIITGWYKRAQDIR
jgi:hypothetical protein